MKKGREWEGGKRGGEKQDLTSSCVAVAQKMVTNNIIFAHLFKTSAEQELMRWSEQLCKVTLCLGLTVHIPTTSTTLCCYSYTPTHTQPHNTHTHTDREAEKTKVMSTQRKLNTNCNIDFPKLRQTLCVLMLVPIALCQTNHCVRALSRNRTHFSYTCIILYTRKMVTTTRQASSSVCTGEEIFTNGLPTLLTCYVIYLTVILNSHLILIIILFCTVSYQHQVIFTDPALTNYL